MTTKIHPNEDPMNVASVVFEKEKNDPTDGVNNLFGAELLDELRREAKREANKLNIHSNDEVDHWYQYKDKADINIWQDPDEKILRASAYPLTGNEIDGFDTDTSQWQGLFAVHNQMHNYTEPPFLFWLGKETK